MTFASTKLTRSPSSAASASPRSALRSAITTPAPDSCRARAVAAPRPEAPPATSALAPPILSPLAWDLGHIANFEELWLVQTIGGRRPLRGELGRFYDAIENPRRTRGELPILRGDELRAYLDEVRERTLGVLDGLELESAEDPLLADG